MNTDKRRLKRHLLSVFIRFHRRLKSFFLRLLTVPAPTEAHIDLECGTQRFLDRIRNAPDRGTGGMIRWTRDEVHER